MVRLMAASTNLRWLGRCVTVPWWLASVFERRLGIAATLILGIALIIFGLLLSLTLAGMIAGLPTLLIGTLFLLRALY